MFTNDDIVKKVREIISTELVLNDFDANSNFFELGGESVKAITICDKIKNVFNIDIELHEFFEFETVLDLEKRVLKKIEEKM